MILIGRSLGLKTIINKLLFSPLYLGVALSRRLLARTLFFPTIFFFRSLSFRHPERTREKYVRGGTPNTRLIMINMAR